jgi:hypothetical protein
MRESALALGCAAMGATLMLLGAPAAQADDDSFVRDAKALGFAQAGVSLISTAKSSCYFLGPRHRNPIEVENRIARYHVVDQGPAHQFLILAVNEYCPQYAHLAGA